MGVILADRLFTLQPNSTPHTHGGDSWWHVFRRKYHLVLPIHMGVILWVIAFVCSAGGTPHTHGGDSVYNQEKINDLKYSPYTWG